MTTKAKKKTFPAMYCETVADTIKALSRLPPGTPVNSTFDEGVIVTFFNQLRDDPHVQFEPSDMRDDRTIVVRAKKAKVPRD